MSTTPERLIIGRRKSRLNSVTECNSLERTLSEIDTANRSFQRSISPKSLTSKIALIKMIIIPKNKCVAGIKSSHKMTEGDLEPSASSIPNFEMQLKSLSMFRRINKKCSTLSTKMPDSHKIVIPQFLQASASIIHGESSVNSIAQSQSPLIKYPCSKKTLNKNNLINTHSLLGLTIGSDTPLRIKKVITFEEFKSSLSRNSANDFSPKSILKTRSKVAESNMRCINPFDASVKKGTKDNNVKFSKMITFYRFNPNEQIEKF